MSPSHLFLIGTITKCILVPSQHWATTWKLNWELGPNKVTRRPIDSDSHKNPPDGMPCVGLPTFSI